MDSRFKQGSTPRVRMSAFAAVLFFPPVHLFICSHTSRPLADEIQNLGLEAYQVVSGSGQVLSGSSITEDEKIIVKYT